MAKAPKNPPSTPTRRSFLGGSVAAGAGMMIVPRHVLGRGFRAPSDTLNVGGIGGGGKGSADLAAIGDSANIVAIADVDWERSAKSFKNFPKAKKFKDFREMLDKHPEIDAVTISTPDHTHAYMALTALARGKHVFCQKPLTRTIHEARVLANAARKAGVATQMGNQGHAGEGTRQIREWIEAGVIGKVERVEYWTNRPIWPQAMARETGAHNVPPDLDWDLWLGPAPKRPYNPAYAPFNWRGWWDYGTGALGDIACHSMDAAFWALDLKNPKLVKAETTKLYRETAPACCRITYEFEATDKRGPITVVWRDGELMPERPTQFPKDKIWPGQNSGQLIVGTDGLIMADMYATKPVLYPEELHSDTKSNPPAEKYPRTKGVYQEWVDACVSGGTGGSNFPDHAGPLTEMVLLGNLAVRSGGEQIEWDSKNLRVTNAEAPNKFIKEPYRKGWRLPELESGDTQGTGA